jgi:hypothetical protein
LISKITNIRKTDITMMPMALVKTLALTPDAEETRASRIRKGRPSAIARTAIRGRDIGAIPDE